MTDITDDDLMSRYDYIEHNVDSIEECARYSNDDSISSIYSYIFYRLCSLGSACDTFFYEKLTGGTKQCTYLPHASLKQFEFVDFVNYDPDPKKLMFVLQCLQGNIEMIFKSF